MCSMLRGFPPPMPPTSWSGRAGYAGVTQTEMAEAEKALRQKSLGNKLKDSSDIVTDMARRTMPG
jgi:hypothetical protein